VDVSAEAAGLLGDSHHVSRLTRGASVKAIDPARCEPNIEVRLLMSISKPVRIFGLLLAIVQATALAQPAVRYHNLSKKQLRALIASAKTPADHEAIAAYYHAKAQRYLTKYRKEEAALAEYNRNPIGYPSKHPTVGDTDRGLASYYETHAERAAALEQAQEKLAHKGK
jgi:hypothetical protein